MYNFYFSFVATEICDKVSDQPVARTRTNAHTRTDIKTKRGTEKVE